MNAPLTNNLHYAKKEQQKKIGKQNWKKSEKKPEFFSKKLNPSKPFCCFILENIPTYTVNHKSTFIHF